ncbi:MAG: FkbO/Hyg5 family chorismatase [Actinomycetota bacterium]|nr:FkbO/Hyg5 family chorismatase [Actinomycetota bacterium]
MRITGSSSRARYDQDGDTTPPRDLASSLRSRFVDLGTVGVDDGFRRPLAAVHHAAEVAEEPAGSVVPQLTVPMATGGQPGFTELWETTGPVTAGRYAGLRYSHDGEHLFCAGRIAAAPRYSEAVRQAYGEAFRLMESLGFPYAFRMWNFVSGINDANADGVEVYRDFCIGRAEAVDRWATDGVMPAATGVGAHGGGIAFCLLASRSVRPVHLENPGQVPAYHYPPEHGPRAPSFARATYLAGPDGAPGHLYVSGTASIRGHRTVHEGDLDRQVACALENIDRVVGRDNLAAHGVPGGYSRADLRTVKVYVRHAGDLERVRRLCREAFSPEADIALLTVDICRADLLVEIEGIVETEKHRD